MLTGIRTGRSRIAALSCLAVVSLCVGVIGPAEARAAAGEEALAPQILAEAGVKGGLIVHVGCGDGKLTVALRAGDSYLVHGLDADAANIEKAREHIRKLGLSGNVSVEQWTGDRLPYTDNLVNLVVSENLGKVSKDEVLRVLAPNGVAYIKGKKTVKPRPKEIDEWTHFLHDASNNAVAKDTVVGPPRHMQWLAAPMWSRHHHTLASISSVVSAGGRIFYILDEATAANMAVPGKWSLIARGAFNGVLLWKHPMPSWAYHRKGFRSGPVQLPRTLIAKGRRVYAPLAMNAPVSALDAATGKIVRTYKETKGAEELILHEGVLIVVTGSPMAEQAGVDPALRGEAKYPNKKTIVAVRAETGEVLWQWSDSPTGKLMPLTLAAEGKGVFFQTGKGLTCLDGESGKQLWRFGQTGVAKPKANPKKPPPKKGRQRKSPGKRGVGWSVAVLVVHDGVVLWADGGKLTAVSAKTGKALWNCPSRAGLCKSPADVLVVANLVWLGPHFTQGRDPHTGKVKKTNKVYSDLWTAGHHHRCYREKATDRYIMSGYRGIELLDLVGDNHSRNNWVRGTCQYGIMPSNGLIYAPPHACGCLMEAKLYGFWALAPARKARPALTGPRLQEGPAYGKASAFAKASADRPAGKSAAGNSDWPTHRGNATRSGVTASALPAQLKQQWKADIGGKLTQPVIAGGKLLVASVDTHMVYALDANNGKRLWSYTTGGRVDSSPTIHKGLALFGSADGWVYCLRVSDGKEAWRFHAAPQNLKTVALDQVESLWPVHGNVLVHKGIAYFAAGRSSWLDGGIMLYGLDPATGKVVHQSPLRSSHPKLHEGKDETAGKYATRFVQNATDYKTFKAPDRSDAFSMGGGTTDVLVGDGESVYMRHLRFNSKLASQDRMNMHLFSTSGLLDDAENHRSHWVFGTGDFSRTHVAYSWIAYKPGSYGSRLSVPYGLMLTFDDKTIWSIKRGRLMKWNVKGTGQYMLMAETRPQPPKGDKHLRDFRKTSAVNNKPKFQWSAGLGMWPRAMLKAGKRLFVGGTTDQIDPKDPHGPFEGRKAGVLQVMSGADGAKIAEYKLGAPPVWDGMAAAGGRLYLATADGKVTCMAAKK